MQSLKRYGTETQYGTALANNQFVNNQITLTDDDGLVHFLFQNYQFNVTVDDENDGADLIIEGNDGVRMFTQNDTTLADFTDTEFDVLKYGDKRPTFTIARNNSVGTITDIQYYQYYDTDWKRRFWDYQFCVEEFFNYTNLSNSTQPLKFIVDEAYTELLEVTTSNNKVYTFFRKPTTGGNHTKIIMLFASIEDMWKLMIVCKTDNPAYSAISSKYDSPNSSNGYTGRELANISDSVFAKMKTLKNASDFDVFRYFTGVTTIPSTSITAGSRNAFFYNSAITHIVFPNTLTTIGDCAFYNSKKITELKLPKSLKTIGTYAFYYCEGVTGEVVLPYGITSLASYAFLHCIKITKIVFKGTKSISGYAVRNCTGLTEVVFPQMLNSIGDYAFDGCSSLNKITCFAKRVPSITNRTFGSSNSSHVANNGTLYRPAGSNYRTWMRTSKYYLGKYSWTQADLTESGMWEI